jgi:hypothetical protein
MRTRRLAGLGLGLMGTVALAVAGCTADGTTPGAGTSSPSSTLAPGAPASSGAADPAAAAALGRAAAALGNQSFKATLTAGPGVKLVALVDPQAGTGTSTVDLSGPNANLQIKSLLLGQDVYVQIPGVTKANTWTHLDVSRLPEGSTFGLRPGQVDPGNTAQALTSATDVQQVDSRSYKGTLDLTKVLGITGVDKVTVDGMGTAAQKVPFTVGLDDQGRPAEMTIQLPAVNGKQNPPVDVLYTDYGTTVNVQRPPASAITEAPDNVYTTLGGR